MLILAFESSAKAASVALCRDGHLVSQYSQCSGLTHSRTLLPMAEDMLKNAELSIGDVDVFAVAHGPGSFTGIRIGVSTVKGLAWASDKPCIGVSTLEAMAWHGVSAGGYVCPVMDARRIQVYNAIFKIEGGRPVRMERTTAVDPQARRLYADASKLDHKWITVTPSDHYYAAPLPAGTRHVEVTARDRFGNVWRAEKKIEQ